ncbi:N-acetylneuraminate synthase family protein [Candidatus Pelagibacter ubique]|jgi:N,N'-diacetyllegionaminate synthase|nr:N-acetylneuraminate synthase family protein [Candidatus Pelagibacter ubique]
MKIKKKIISSKNLPFIIAEIGINHNGKLSNAFKLIDYAINAKCDAVKFQTINIKNLMIENSPLADYQKNRRFKNMNDLISAYNFNHADFIKIKNYCDQKKIIFLSTPFDEESAFFLNKIEVPAFKISSSDNDNLLLIETVKKFKKPIIISTGMMNLIEIKKLLKIIKLNNNQLALLHCVSDYPTKLKDTKLGSIEQLKQLGYLVGFSDHTLGAEASIAATARGGVIIEKHITLDKLMEGPDHKASLECKDLEKFVRTIKEIASSLKIKKNSISNSEKKTKLIAKKSLYFSTNLKKNYRIKKTDIISLRPRKNGISPLYYKKIINKKLIRDVKKQEIVSQSDLK